VSVLLDGLYGVRPPDTLREEVARVLNGVLAAMGSLDSQEHIGESLDATVRPWFRKAEAP
jgi:hypothetical protein